MAFVHLHVHTQYSILDGLSVVLGVSAKLDYPQVEELWQGVVVAAKEFGYKDLSLDLQPSQNGHRISVSAN